MRQRDNDNILRHNLFAERGLDCLIAIGDVTAQCMLELLDADDRLRNVGTVNDDIIGEVFADTIDRLSGLLSTSVAHIAAGNEIPRHPHLVICAPAAILGATQDKRVRRP